MVLVYSSDLDLCIISDELPMKPPPTEPQNGDAHVCGKCRAEFLELHAFIAHKKECSKEQVVILYDEKPTGGDDQSELCNINGVSSRLSEDPEMDNLEAVSPTVGSDVEEDVDNVEEKAEDEVDAAVGVEEDNVEEGSESAFNDMEDEELKSLMNDGDEEEEEDELDSLKDEELDDEIKPEMNSDIPPYMLPLAHLAAGSNSNVLLEPLQATKAAVAQFAENNLPKQDSNQLHHALVNLQHQQIMQLQLIHQLQQQLIANGAQNGQLPSALLNGRLNLSNLGLNMPFPPGLGAKPSEQSKSPTPDDSKSSSEGLDLSMDEKVKESLAPKSSVSSLSERSESPVNSSKISSEEVAPPSSNGVEKPTGNSSSAQSTSSSAALDFSRTSKCK